MVIDITELDKFVASQAKMASIYKNQNKSLNLLNLRYKILNKTLGPFYKLYIDTKNATETTTDVMTSLGKTTEKLGESFKKLGKPVSGFLSFLRKINTIMIFILGVFALLGAAIFLITKEFGGGEIAVGAFNNVMDAGRGLVDAFMGVLEGLGAAIGSLDFSSVTGIFIPMLETVFALLGDILALYITIITMVLQGIGDIVSRMAESGMLQRIVDAFGVLLGLVAMAFGTIKKAIDDVGITFGGIIDFISNAISGFVDFLFSSGIIDFAVTVIEYALTIVGVIVNVFGIIIAVWIKVVAAVAPPLIRLVKAIFKVVGPILKLILGVIGLILKAIMALFDKVSPYIEGVVDAIMGFLEPVLDVITAILDGVGNVLDKAGDFIGGGVDKIGGFLGFNDGGIARGPKSGYPVTLHGTEAVVPLPDGRTIPVSIKTDGGMGGSTTNNISISVKGGGNAKEIAKAVSDEVTKVMRNKRRGGNYSRGVI